MIIYCVMQHESWVGTFLHSIGSTREKAEKVALYYGNEYYVDEVLIDDPDNEPN